MTGCAGCGACCEVIALPQAPADLARMTGLQGHAPFELLAAGWPQDDVQSAYDADFIREHLHELAPDTARARNPRLVDGAAYGYGNRSYYTCDQYDATTRRCLAYDRRPRMCTDFPWYHATPHPLSLMPFSRCSYWRDLPETDWPAHVTPLEDPTCRSREQAMPVSCC